MRPAPKLPLCSLSWFCPFRNCLDWKRPCPSRSGSHLLKTYVCDKEKWWAGGKSHCRGLSYLIWKNQVHRYYSKNFLLLSFLVLSSPVGLVSCSLGSTCLSLATVHQHAPSQVSLNIPVWKGDWLGMAMWRLQELALCFFCGVQWQSINNFRAILMLKDSSASLILAIFRVQNSQSVWRTSQSSCSLLLLPL